MTDDLTLSGAQKIAAILSAGDNYEEMAELIWPLNEAFPHLRFWMTFGKDDFADVHVEKRETGA
jgi:hypothetical protein